MGMTIDEHKEHLIAIMDSMPDDTCGDWRDSLAFAVDTMRKYQMMQADYNARLKADMVAMLTDIQLEIEETVKEEELIDKKWANGLHYSEKIIQQKIDKLKEVEDANKE